MMVKQGPDRPRHLPGSLLSYTLPILILIVWMLYAPGVNGGFYLDDFVQILYNPYLQHLRPEWNALKAVVLTSTSGPTGRPVSMLTFAVDQLLHGLDPTIMKMVNVSIHSINGLLLYRLLTLLLPRLPKFSPTRPHMTALLLTALWLAQPLHVSTVLYIVQRMTLLSASFTLLGLIGYCRFRCRPHPNLSLALTSLFVATLIATLAKENGALTLVYAGLIEIFVLRFRNLPLSSRRLLQVLFIGLPLLGTVAIAAYWLSDPTWFTRAYAHRDFDVIERLLTETRALAFYQRLILLPDLSAMGLYHDDFALSKSLLDPPTTLLAVLWHGFLLGAAWKLRDKIPLFSFGIAWFYASHLLESTVIPLELVFEHRNYLAAAGLLLALYGLLDTLVSHAAATGTASRLVPAMLAGLTAVFLSATAVRAADWGDFFGHALMEARRHPASARSQFEAGQTLARGLNRNRRLVDEYYEQARKHYWASARLAPEAIAPLVSLLELDGAIAHRIDGQVVAELAHRLRYGKPDASTGHNLHTLTRQILESEDDLFSKQQVLTLFDAALSNPKMGNRNRAEVLVGKALYLKGQGAPLATVITLLSQAVELMPKTPGYRLLLTAFQVDAGAYREAARELSEIEKYDRYKVFKEDIRKLRDKVNAVRSNRLPKPLGSVIGESFHHLGSSPLH